MDCVFEAFWKDIIKRDISALEIIESLKGDAEIIQIIENILCGTMFKISHDKNNIYLSYDEQGIIYGRIEKIRDSWLDQVLDAGIESEKLTIWDPQLLYDEAHYCWRFLTIPISYKLLKSVAVGNCITEEEAFLSINRVIEKRFNNKIDAVATFNSIVKKIREVGLDTASEKYRMVRFLRKYRDSEM